MKLYGESGVEMFKRKEEFMRTNWMRVTTARLAAALVLAAVLVAGCGSKSGDSATASGNSTTTATTAKAIGGSVSLGGPITGATVKIFDVGGNPVDLNTSPHNVDTTDRKGLYGIVTKSLPADFRIVISGGKLDGVPLGADLVGDVANFSGRLVFVNAATTLAATYRDTHPGMTVADAQTAVKNYLAISQAVDISSRMIKLQSDFDHAAFLTIAAGNGGVTAYIATLVAEMNAGTSKTRSFKSAATAQSRDVTLVSPTGVLIGTLETSLGTQVVGAVAGPIFGAVLKAIGPPLYTNPNKDVLDKLDKLDDKMTLLSNSIAALQQAVISTTWQTSFNTTAGQLNPAISLIQDTNANLREIADYADPTQHKPYIDQVQASILDSFKANTTATLSNQATTIHNALMSPATGADGLIVIYSKARSTEQDFFTPNQSTQIQVMYDYYHLYQLALEVLTENYKGMYENSNSTVDKAKSDYLGRIASQKAKLPRPLPAGTVIHVKQNLMIENVYRIGPYWGSFSGDDCALWNYFYSFGAPFSTRPSSGALSCFPSYLDGNVNGEEVLWGAYTPTASCPTQQYCIDHFANATWSGYFDNASHSIAWGMTMKPFLPFQNSQSIPYLNSHNNLGFSDWRAPTIVDANSIFMGKTTTSLEAQGFTAYKNLGGVLFAIHPFAPNYGSPYCAGGNGCQLLDAVYDPSSSVGLSAYPTGSISWREMAYSKGGLERDITILLVRTPVVTPATSTSPYTGELYYY